MRQQITDLREQRAGLYVQMTEMSAAAEAEGRDFTAEEYTKYNALEADFDSLTKRAERLEREAGIAPEQKLAAQRDARDPNKDPERVEFENRGRPQTYEEQQRALRASQEYRDAFDALLRVGTKGEIPAEVRAALTVGTDAQGGYTVPDDFVRQLIESEIEFSVIRQLATVITTANNGQVLIPTLASEAVAAKIAEEGTYAGTEPTFGQKVLDSYKYGQMIKVSDELVADSAFDVTGLIARLAGRALGTVTGTAFVVGNGSSNPNGVATAAAAGKTMATGNPTTIDIDGLTDLQHSVVSAYRNRPGAGFVMNDLTLAFVRKIKTGLSGDKTTLWQPSVQAGVPDSLLGKPCYTDPNVATLAASSKVVLFGDFSEYWIRDVEGVTVKVLQERYADTGQIGVRVSQRTDGELADSAAVKALVTSAT